MVNFIRNLDWSVLTDILARVIPALICITFHELAHGFTAYLLGDRTAKDQGRLTLNPVKHIDVFGLLMMIICKFGWAKPVPVNMYNFKKPKLHMAITALAGPLSNILLAVVVFFILGLITTPLGYISSPELKTYIFEMIYTTAYLNIALAVFNMLPIPPLDGSKILFSLLPEKAYFVLMRYERYGMLILFVFINIDTILHANIFNATIGQLTLSLVEWFSNVGLAAYRLVN